MAIKRRDEALRQRTQLDLIHWLLNEDVGRYFLLEHSPSPIAALIPLLFRLDRLREDFRGP